MLSALARFYNFNESATVEMLVRVGANELGLNNPEGRERAGQAHLKDVLAHPARGLEDDVATMNASRKNARAILDSD
jgi:hypothetical protein